MGYRNVDAAFRLYSQPLADRQPAFRVLVYMALRSQDVDTDEQDARIYFAGHEALAVEGLGFEAYDAAGRQAVKRALTVLREAEAITLLSAGHRGRNSQYGLQLDTANIGVRPTYPYPVDNFSMGDADRTPTGQRKGYAERPERGTFSDPKGVRPTYPLQEDKKYKNSPYPLADDSSGLPVDNSEGEEKANQAAAEPPIMATDYAARLKADVSSRNGNVASATASAGPDHFNRSVKATANNFAGSPKVSPPPSTEVLRRPPENPDQVPAEDRAAIELLTADGTDLALATDMLAYAKNDPETKAAHARIRQAKYREQLRSAVLNERNRQHSAAAKAAGPCPHGELGGLVPTRAGTPTCVSCRAETRHHRETA